MGEAALLFQIVVRPAAQRRHGVAGEEVRGYPRFRRLQETALTPFSQNSKDDPCSGSPQAQPGQSNPSGWLVFNSVRAPEIGAPDSSRRLPTLFKAPQPPAAFDALPMKPFLLMILLSRPILKRLPRGLPFVKSASRSAQPALCQCIIVQCTHALKSGSPETVERRKGGRRCRKLTGVNTWDCV